MNERSNKMSFPFRPVALFICSLNLGVKFFWCRSKCDQINQLKQKLRISREKLPTNTTSAKNTRSLYKYSSHQQTVYVCMWRGCFCVRACVCSCVLLYLSFFMCRCSSFCMVEMLSSRCLCFSIFFLNRFLSYFHYLVLLACF